MTKRVQLNEVPYKEIQVGEKVVFLSSSHSYTSMNFGIYRGLYGLTPVVEHFSRERKWHLDDRGRYVQDNHWSIVARRIHLPKGRVFSINRIGAMIEDTPDYKDIEALINKPE